MLNQRRNATAQSIRHQLTRCDTMIAACALAVMSLASATWGVVGSTGNAPLTQGHTFIESTVTDDTANAAQDFMNDVHRVLAGDTSELPPRRATSTTDVIDTVIQGNKISPYSRLSPYRPPTAILDAHDGAVIVCDGENDTQFIDPNGNSVTRDTRVAYLLHVSEKTRTVESVEPHSRIVCEIAEKNR